MLDKLINLEIRSVFFSSDYINVLMVAVAAMLFMIVIHQVSGKEWLSFFTGILILWERTLLLKINKLKILVGGI